MDFERTDRDFIRWTSGGLSEDATANAELESDGDLHPLAVDDATGEITGYFAGPDAASPGAAVIVSGTSHIEIHIVDGSVTRTLDGGFIRLVP